MQQADTKTLSRFTGFLIALLGSILFSTKAIIVKKAFADTHTDALTLLAIRMAFALPFFVGAAVFSSNQKTNTKFSPKQWTTVCLLGIFGYYLSSLFDFIGLQYISAGLERLILFLYPSFVVFINAIFLQQKITRFQRIALLLTYTGIAVAYFGELQVDLDNPQFFLGTGAVFICAITFSIYIAGSGKIIPAVGASKFTAYSMMAATVGIFLHFLLANSYTKIPSGIGFWGYGLLLALVATVAPIFLIAYALKRIGANNVAIISGIGPVSTILQAHFVLDEPVFMEQLIGTALVIAGILLMGWKINTETA